MSFFNRHLLFLGMVLIPLATTMAQFGGARAGVSRGDEPGHAGHGPPPLNPEVVQAYITIEGQAELRVQPTEVRVVLAVTAEGPTPAECKRQVSERMKALTAGWREMGIRQDDIVPDFIAVLPRYEFEIDQVRNREVAVERKVGYLMQSNLHLALKDDAQAMSAIHIAFENGIADIIGFDYWSQKLDQAKVRARAEALRAAREKSDVMLKDLFDERPPIINLQESTRVYFPESLYESFTNSSDAAYQTSYSRRGIPQIRTFRPKNTYYRGLYLDGDVQSKELPMRSEIYVVSTVRLYYESPVSKELPSPKKDSQQTQPNR